MTENLLFCLIFAQNYFSMETQKKNTGIWWLVFFASTVALIAAIYLHWEWLTLILPFQCTSFVKAMDIM
jgi:hypothetical protein